MEIVDSETAVEWRPWEPPMWLFALGLCAALLVGLMRSGDVRDPRLVNATSPTPCVPPQGNTWTLCPQR